MAFGGSILSLLRRDEASCGDLSNRSTTETLPFVGIITVDSLRDYLQQLPVVACLMESNRIFLPKTSRVKIS